ncbi:CGNR zinc finger domain-containing protein [Acidisarcina polymorpha]|uniref:CGNR zinc finger domain-containing protein n=1 Tax=Acidisarcina polymorpha TaxID=2211140 RepID=UPI000DEEEEA6
MCKRVDQNQDERRCVHWFHCLARAGRRRWCSMAICGNCLKVKSYRQRPRSL